jgi:hypothetical protein
MENTEQVDHVDDAASDSDETSEADETVLPSCSRSVETPGHILRICLDSTIPASPPLPSPPLLSALWRALANLKIFGGLQMLVREF